LQGLQSQIAAPCLSLFIVDKQYSTPSSQGKRTLIYTESLSGILLLSVK